MVDTLAPRAIRSAWADDLPAVAPDGTILARDGKDVVALSADSLAVVGRVTGGAADAWLTAPWDPRRPPLQVAENAGGQTSTPADQSNAQMYVQVSSTSNAGWASDLANDLRQAGLKATVLAPADSDQMYRVVIGPFASRDAAEATGRKLGMPFWIYTPTPPAPPTP
jgi:SPOR domain